MYVRGVFERVESLLLYCGPQRLNSYYRVSRLEDKEERDRGRERNVDVERHIPQIGFVVYIILVPLVVQQNKFLILFKSPFVNYLV